MDNVFISIGSNLGDRIGVCTLAVKKIESEGNIKIIEKSSFYETEPVGYTNQPYFINQVIKITTSLCPEDLLGFLLATEKQLGRVRSRKWGPRIIDLDLLFYDQQSIHNKNLVVPHPELHNRKFVLMPLSQINPDFNHPLLKKTIGELLSKTSDTTIVKKVTMSDGIYYKS